MNVWTALSAERNAVISWVAVPQFFGAVGPGQFIVGQAKMQGVVKLPWIESFGIEYLLGIDGISLPLVVLTTFISMLAATN
ncbi:unnamed protein product [marine sediment metagenome]|uniref:Uncharacterized protein n=1 Tax=marine sediment metagenome TaxID=412755 RepID=X1A3T8_9ZZZZ